MTDARPEIIRITSGAELRRWYWMKDELVIAARHHGLKKSGGKFQILDRIAHYLDTGEQVFPGDELRTPNSKFDWHSAHLTRETLITDNYKNTQNVRRFFQLEIDPNFKFKIALMDWMRANVGKTLADAVKAFQEEQAAMSKPGARTSIKDHNQFNQYTRDFLDDNPSATMGDVRKIWAKKRALPMEDGRHRYDRSDLDL